MLVIFAQVEKLPSTVNVDELNLADHMNQNRKNV